MLPVRVERRRNLPSRWLEPLSEMDWMTNFDRLVDRVFGMREAGGAYLPADVWEDDDNLYIELELPGLKAEDVSISYKDGLIQIEGDRKTEEHKGNVYMSERFSGRFSRTFQVPNVIDPDHIEATFKEGILALKCAKKAETKAHKIEIKTK